MIAQLKCANFMYLLNLQFLETLDTVLIPRDYPNVSREVADRTTQGSLMFVDMCATLNIHPVQGWSVEPDKKLVKCEVGHTLKITLSNFRSCVVKWISLRWRSTDLRISTTTLPG